MREFFRTMRDGTEVFCTLWAEVEQPIGALLIVHGIAEYGGRYGEFAKFLNQNGYIALACDLRGHGRTESERQRGHHTGAVFSDTVSDLIELYTYLKDNHSLPVFLLGYSYGSFLVQSFLEQGIGIAGAVLVGSAHIPRSLAVFAAVLLLPFRLLFPRWRPKFVFTMADILWSRRFEKGQKFLWLTRNHEKRKEYQENPYCGIPVSVQIYYSILRGIGDFNRPERLAKLNLLTPIALFSGADDPVGGYGRRVNALHSRYKDCGVREVSLALYQAARHELLNETNRVEVYLEIHRFFQRCLENEIA